MKKFRIGVVGSRDYNNKQEIYKYLDSKLDKISSVVSGGCPTGADAIAQEYCKDRGISITIHYPDWKGLGKKAGFSRNRKIVTDCDVLIAWWTGSKGTENSINIAKEMGKKIVIHKVESETPPKETEKSEFEVPA